MNGKTPPKKNEYSPNSSRSAECFKVRMVSLAQGMREKKRLKGDEF